MKEKTKHYYKLEKLLLSDNKEDNLKGVELLKNTSTRQVCLDLQKEVYENCIGAKSENEYMLSQKYRLNRETFRIRLFTYLKKL
jgi:hypothetical protein